MLRMLYVFVRRDKNTHVARQGRGEVGKARRILEGEGKTWKNGQGFQFGGWVSKSRQGSGGKEGQGKRLQRG